jgi:hypothetical protein
MSRAMFDGRNRALKLRAVCGARANNLNAIVIRAGTFSTLQRFNDLTWRSPCWL